MFLGTMKGQLLAVLLHLSVWLYVSGVTIDQLIAGSIDTTKALDFVQGDETVLVELDIKYSKQDWLDMNDDRTSVSGMDERKAERDTRKRWTDKVIPYELAPYTFSSYDMQQINQAIAEWNTYTCVKFRPSNREYNRIYLQNGNGCSSYVGMVGGAQSVSLAPGCRVKGVIVHELGHAVGFQHEQTRPDRNDYVTIQKRNISPGMEYNFNHYSDKVVNNYNVPYDYMSVMHYGKTAFSVNGYPTIITKDPAYQDRIGDRGGLSFRDVKLANIMYNCGAGCPSKNCPGEGFVGKDCDCWCPGNPVKKCDDEGGEVPPEGCTDSSEHCPAWANLGECEKNPEWMLTHCRKSCDYCDNGGGAEPCVDSSEHCPTWADMGECQKNPDWMLINCRKSCDQCEGGGETETCKDFNPQCAAWAATGECQKNPNYMLPNCRKSCNRCQDDEVPCTDSNQHCQAWAGSGECQKNPGYMLSYCKMSCNHCDGSSAPPVCTDLNTDCGYWAQTGYCTHPAYVSYMTSNCPKSCRLCSRETHHQEEPQAEKSCSNNHKYCELWAKKGGCDKHVAVMRQHCKKACGVC